MKKIISIICLLTMVLSLVSGFSVFAEVKKADVEFNVEETDEIINVSVKVKNASFMMFQTAVRYDKEVIAPVTASGEDAAEYSDFASYNEDLDFFSFIGERLDKEKGYFGWTMYIMPDEESEKLNDNKEYIADKNADELVNFKFKRLKEGSMGFEIALKDDVKPYEAALPEGLLLLGIKDQYDTNVSYIYGEEKQEQEIIFEQPAPVVKEETPVVKDEEKEDTEKELTSLERKKDVICLKIGKSMTITYDKKTLIDENPLVVPYIVNDRTLVPLRFISEKLGAEVLWEDGWDGCVIKKGETEIKITFGSAEFLVNGEKFTYEAPIEVVNDRTMVPVRFVSEVLGQDVYWHEGAELVIISPIDKPWVETRQAEKTAIDEMLISILGIL